MDQPQIFTSNVRQEPVMNNNNMGPFQDPFMGMAFPRMNQPAFFMFQGDEAEPQNQGVSEEYLDKLP